MYDLDYIEDHIVEEVMASVTSRILVVMALITCGIVPEVISFRTSLSYSNRIGTSFRFLPKCQATLKGISLSS